MEPVVELTPVEATVEPGQSAQFAVRVHNPSEIVEGYRLDVIGDIAAWSDISPGEVNVYPGKDATASLVVRPPADPGGPKGAIAFAIRAVSVKDRLRASVEEGTLHIGEQVAATISVTPQEAACRRRATFQVELANKGNTALNLRLRASDPGAAVRFEFDQPVVSVQPGQVGWAMLRAMPPPILRGSEAKHRIDVSFAEHDPSTPAWAPFSPRSRQGVAGSAAVDLVQRPLLPKRAMGLAGLAGLMAIAALGYKTAQPAKPTVESVVQAGDDTVTVSFKPVDRARGDYEVVRYQADRSTRAQGPATKAARPPGADLVTAQVGGLPPGTHCFGVKARGLLGVSSTSAVTEDDCIALAELTLEPPADFAIAPTEERKEFRLSWTAKEGEVYQLLRENRVDGEPVQGDNTVVTLEEYTCFKVQAALPDLSKKSPPTAEACAGGPEIRIIVYKTTNAREDLTPVKQAAAEHFGWDINEVVSGPRNNIFVVMGPLLKNEAEGKALCAERRQGWETAIGRGCDATPLGG